MNIPQKETASDTKQPLFAGIDVGADELVLVIRKNNKSLNPQTFSNTSSDRARLVNKLSKLPNLIVCLEATGVYHFDLSIALHDAGVSLMVLNPKASHNFAKVLMKNSKTDAVDANTLAEYAERMAFVAWTRPSNEKIALRSVARRINSLNKQKAAAKNHLHALTATTETPKAVLKDANLALSQLEKRIESLTTAALLLIAKHPELARILHLLISIKGIAETSAIALMGELLLLPPDLSHRQWVTTQGLIRKPSSQAKAFTKKRASPNRATPISAPPSICLP